MRPWIVATTWFIPLLMSLQNTRADDIPPPYPHYTLDVFPVRGAEAIVSSNPLGLADYQTPDLGGYKYIRIFTDPGQPDVKFNYICSFQSTDGKNYDSVTSYNGETCPPNGLSNFMRGITISLDGPKKYFYTLNVSCTIDYFGGYPPSSYNVGNGQICGNSSLSGAPAQWIRDLKIEMHRK